MESHDGLEGVIASLLETGAWSIAAFKGVRSSNSRGWKCVSGKYQGEVSSSGRPIFLLTFTHSHRSKQALSTKSPYLIDETFQSHISRKSELSGGEVLSLKGV